MNLIHRLAFRYSGNILAKALVRPIYRMFVACKLNQKKRVFRRNAKLLLEKLKEALDSNGILFWLVYKVMTTQFSNNSISENNLRFINCPN